MLQVDALKKSYGNLVAVNGVSLHAGAGRLSVFWDRTALEKPPPSL